MALTAAAAPITEDDATLRAHLADAEIPALLMTLAHLTGDLSLLRDEYHANGWLFRHQGGLSPDQQARVRAMALDVLRQYRDRGCPAVPPPDTRTLRRIADWALGGDAAEFVPLLAEELPAPGTDPRAPGWHKDELAPGADFQVAIIGAGMSGLLAAHRLAQAGVDFVIYEKNADVGGTWFANTYPGCRVDVPSHLYSYSFAPKLDWPHHFCTQDVLLTYFQDFAKESGLYEHIRFNTEVTEAAWDENDARWRLTLAGEAGQETAESHLLISAVGQLSRPALPRIPGRDTFAGPAFHSARWDHSVDLTGRRVGVIGTGASAYQFIPEIAADTGELLVFQRTPPWLRPTPHYHDPVSDSARWLYEHVPHYAAWYRCWLFAPGLRGILEGWIVDPGYPPTERAVSARNEEMRRTLTRAMEEQLTDAPELRPHMIPRYPVGAKRVLRDNNRWIPTLKRDDVHLVTEAIDRITPRGVRMAGGQEHQLDVLIYGTGFLAHEFLAPIRVTGRGGADLHRTWNGNARAYLGMTAPGFPNLFCLYGPNTNLSGQAGSIFYFSECAVRYILDAVRLLLERKAGAVEVHREVHDRYNAWVDSGNAARAWGFSSVRTWHWNREAGRSVTNWPFSALEYWERTRSVAPEEYEIR